MKTTHIGRRKAPGILPCDHWLETHGLRGLVQAKRLHPEAFTHIKQAWAGGLSPKEWVPIAEQLAKEHKGILPCSSWLRTHGHGTLDRAIRDNRKLFSHINQEWKGKRSLESWKKLARNLAKDNGGKLPTATWLLTHNFAGLYSLILKHPRIFGSIERQRNKYTRIAHWVQIAEALATKNGILPPSGWLHKNYCALYSSMRAWPQAFSHIKQYKCRMIGKTDRRDEKWKRVRK